MQVLFQWNDLKSLSPTNAVKICAMNVQNRPFATNDHLVQNPPCWRASSLLFSHRDVKTKRPQPVLPFVIISQCGNNNKLTLQLGRFCTMWSFVAKGQLKYEKPPVQCGPYLTPPSSPDQRWVTLLSRSARFSAFALCFANTAVVSRRKNSLR